MNIPIKYILVLFSALQLSQHTLASQAAASSSQEDQLTCSITTPTECSHCQEAKSTINDLRRLLILVQGELGNERNRLASDNDAIYAGLNQTVNQLYKKLSDTTFTLDARTAELARAKSELSTLKVNAEAICNELGCTKNTLADTQDALLQIECRAK
ncbi:MAG: hypothetical protein NTZ68_02245 [Candidatus Dependentiae bacterium]|nr:hypothetical protein [Candidatus Dependentiae bacterium]